MSQASLWCICVMRLRPPRSTLTYTLFPYTTLCRALAAQGIHFSAYGVDVSGYESVQELARNIHADGRQVDILVNNAGITREDRQSTRLNSRHSCASRMTSSA